MKTNKTITILAAAVVSSAMLLANVQADELMDIIHPESADLFDHSTSISAAGTTGIVSLNDVTDDHVWSYEYEEYVSPVDFQRVVQPESVAQAQQMLDDNPTAAGSKNHREVLMWDEVADEFYLQ